MIIDRIENAPLYVGLGKRIATALDYLGKTDFSRVPPGRCEIDGANLYALVQEYPTKPRETARWEAHRRYIDVQYLVSGVERIGYSPISSLQVIEAYDENKDALFLAGEGDFLLMRPGMFMVLWPEDAHMPGIAVAAPATAGKPTPAKKVVVKVLAEKTTA